MSSFEIGVTGFTILLVLLALRIPIGVAMLSVGMVGYVTIAGPSALLSYLKTETYWRFTSFDLSVAPLFILMGQFAAKAGLSQALFRAANVWLGHYRGGVAMAAIGGCAGFASISGSSLATAALMGKVALPELKKFNYAGSLATGCLAAGGTLGILIPPSIVLIIYAIMVEANIATLFQAAFIPGIFAAIGYLIAIAIVVRINPKAGPAGASASRLEKWSALLEIWPVLLIFLLVMGGIYSGIFTPTEGAAVGAVGTFLIAVTKGGMRLSGTIEAVLETAVTTGMIFLILLGAAIFNAFLGFSELPNLAADFFRESGMAPMTVLLGMVILYILLGFVMDSLSMILLTVPIFWPIIAGLDFGLGPDDLKLWFGIITLIVVEVGLITPPVGLNVFVISSMAKDVPMIETFKGVIPFFISDGVRVVIILAFPIITLILPRLLASD
ncbi:MAG: TRAP transporter large permease [Rhodospirillales bacterium]|jgi:tripartite ATP-independent transporter DctM subunit|nr:C4-dicarboxylate ABC transporter permease [Rhodospirillaceae bacterium]MDP6428277.1 TRAP transporter large permease [Rhodospirillales bacterium]MDP6646142.1 TRAP transporter large permease [Rhodospirillales bacterium]MDP6840691.1 TRAP transporter large permease [Rhodospirillales bacterium]